MIYSRNVRITFLADFQQIFYKSCFVRKSLFHFFVAVVYYTFLQEQLHSSAAAQKLFGRVAAL